MHNLESIGLYLDDTGRNRRSSCATCFEADALEPKRIVEQDVCDIGWRKIAFTVERLPVRICRFCGEQYSGPHAAGYRAEAILRAVVEAWKEERLERGESVTRE